MPLQPARVAQRVANPSLAAGVPARVHIPIYCPLGTEADTVEYMLELLLACLDSYFAHDNAGDLLVTTNDYRVLRAVSSYKLHAGYRFELLFVSQNDLLSAFRIDHAILAQSHCQRMIFSKFYPIFARLGERIVHVDFDTVFMTKVDLEPLFVSDIGLMDTSRFDEPHFWYPNAACAKFFRIDPEVRPVANWLNSGVFSIQKRGFEICRAEVDTCSSDGDCSCAGGEVSCDGPAVDCGGFGAETGDTCTGVGMCGQGSFGCTCNGTTVTCIETDCGADPMDGANCMGFGDCPGSDTCVCQGGEVNCDMGGADCGNNPDEGDNGEDCDGEGACEDAPECSCVDQMIDCGGGGDAGAGNGGTGNGGTAGTDNGGTGGTPGGGGEGGN